MKPEVKLNLFFLKERGTDIRFCFQVLILLTIIILTLAEGIRSPDSDKFSWGFHQFASSIRKESYPNAKAVAPLHRRTKIEIQFVNLSPLHFPQSYDRPPTRFRW